MFSAQTVTLQILVQKPLLIAWLAIMTTLGKNQKDKLLKMKQS
jgi:hypothetical protein